MLSKKVIVRDRHTSAQVIELLRRGCHLADKEMLKSGHASVYVPDIGPQGLWLYSGADGNILLRCEGSSKGRLYRLFNNHSFYYFEGRSEDTGNGCELVGRLKLSNPQRFLKAAFFILFAVGFILATVAVMEIQGGWSSSLLGLIFSYIAIAGVWTWGAWRKLRQSEIKLKRSIEIALRRNQT